MSHSILLVDDDLVLRHTLAYYLQREGFEVTPKESGEAALATLTEHQYDLLLTDNIMTGMTGVELIYKAKNIHPSIKVVVMSGFGDNDSKAKIKELGANDFLHKPIDPEDMLHRIKEIMRTQPYPEVFDSAIPVVIGQDSLSRANLSVKLIVATPDSGYISAAADYHLHKSTMTNFRGIQNKYNLLQ